MPATTAPITAQLSGAIETDGLSAPVRVVRDRWGVPHIYAQNRDDLFFAQGFVQAEDRLFQMDLWHRASMGRLAEVLGANFSARDVMTRRIQYRGNLADEWAAYGPGTRAIATAFVRGVNAWVAIAREHPPEPFVIAGWRPEPWIATDLLSRADAFRGSSSAAIDEVFLSRLVTALGASRTAALLHRGAIEHPGDPARPAIPALVAEVIRRAGGPAFFSGPSGIDSSTTNVMRVPASRYLVHLDAPGWQVAGETAPWLPGVAIGHSDRVAWTMRALDVATQDIDVERVNPSNPHQVEDEGRWVDTTIVHDAIAVKGRKDAFTFDHEFTRHGPIVAEDTDRHLAFVIRWSGAGPGGAAGLGAPALDTASSLAACQAALAHWRFPARTVECRDVDRVTETRASAPSVAVAANRAGDDVGARVLAVARSREDGGDAILRDLVAAGSLADQQKLIARWIEESVRDLRSREALPVVFAHPLALSPAARRRFNIGPTAPPRAWTGPFAFSPDVRDWDRTRVVNAPGQSESPDSAHYADQAAEWSRGAMIPLPFSDAAVQAAADVTLTIVPRAFKQP